MLISRWIGDWSWNRRLVFGLAQIIPHVIACTVVCLLEAFLPATTDPSIPFEYVCMRSQRGRAGGARKIAEEAIPALTQILPFPDGNPVPAAWNRSRAVTLPVAHCPLPARTNIILLIRSLVVWLFSRTKQKDLLCLPAWPMVAGMELKPAAVSCTGQ